MDRWMAEARNECVGPFTSGGSHLKGEQRRRQETVQYACNTVGRAFNFEDKTC